MGAAASTNGARELRNLHTAITASGISRLNTTISDVDQSNHLIRIERLAERLLIREQLMVPIDAVEPGHKTTLMYAAAGAGGEECLAVVKLLKKYTKTKVSFTSLHDLARACMFYDSSTMILLSIIYHISSFFVSLSLLLSLISLSLLSLSYTRFAYSLALLFHTGTISESTFLALS